MTAECAPARSGRRRVCRLILAAMAPAAPAGSRRRRAATLGLSALALTSGLLAACSGDDELPRPEAFDSSTTSTTFDDSRLTFRRRVSPLRRTEVVLAPAIVSEVGGAAVAGGASGTGEVPASQVTRVEGILSELQATRTDRGIVVTLPETVLFDFDEADIRADAADTLGKVAEVLRYHASSPVDIHGHTDSTGDDDYNQRLSERRAEAVKQDLATTHKIDAGRLRSLGFGEKRPVAPNDSDANRQRNRRVEILIRQA